MDYKAYKEGMEFAATHIKEYSVEYARKTIDGVMRRAQGGALLGDYAQGYLDMVEMAEKITKEG